MADWQKGDLALCVRGGFIAGNAQLTDHPAAGALYSVADVRFDAPFSSGRKLGLVLADGPANVTGVSIWPAYRFIKVTPPSDMKAEPRAKAKPEQVV